MPKLSLAKLERHLYSAADRLRQEGLDAATYKDYIFGMLFLKRCSDVFDAEREKIVEAKVEQGMVKEKTETEYGENPDFYDGFFVPERARWGYLQDKLGDAREPYGSVLDKALGALNGPLFLRISNLSREHIDLRLRDVVRVRPPAGSEGARTRVQADDMLISITADLGIIGVVPDYFEEAYVNQHIALVRAGSRVNPRWIGRFLASDPGANQFQRLNDSGAKAGLNLPAVESLLIAVPSLEEQLAATRVLDAIDDHVERELVFAEKLTHIKSGLMTDLLTGRVRVPERIAVTG